jgi:hypothetical protein
MEGAMIRRTGGVEGGQRVPSRTIAARTIALWAGLAVSGCAVGGPDRVDAAGGYPSAEARTRETHHYEAKLIVFTETLLDVSDSDAGARQVYTGYTLYNDQGRKVKYVDQRDVEPYEVSLEPGKYLILLDRPAGRAAMFWIKVERGRISEVHADRLPKASTPS